MTPVSKDQIVSELRALVKSHKSDADAARAIKCTPAQLSVTLSGKNNQVPSRILDALGYTAQLAYFKSDEVPKQKKAKKTTAKKVVAKKTAAKVAKQVVAAKSAPAKKVVAAKPSPAADFISVYNGNAKATKNPDANNAPTTFVSVKD